MVKSREREVPWPGSGFRVYFEMPEPAVEYNHGGEDKGEKNQG